MSETDNAMNEEKTAAPTLAQSVSSNAVLLALFALACTAVIAGTFLGTADRIADQKRAASLKALYQIVPQSSHDNDLLQDNSEFFASELGLRDAEKFYLAQRKGRSVAIIYPTIARDGYSGDIEMLVGINSDSDTIAGVRVLSHRETPGLGDKIEIRKSDWITGFEHRSLTAPHTSGWAVSVDGGEFDSFTGATITPRAVVNAVHRVLQYHESNEASIEHRIRVQTANLSQPVTSSE